MTDRQETPDTATLRAVCQETKRTPTGWALETVTDDTESGRLHPARVGDLLAAETAGDRLRAVGAILAAYGVGTVITHATREVRGDE